MQEREFQLQMLTFSQKCQFFHSATHKLSYRDNSWEGGGEAGADVHIFAFCIINFFWRRRFSQFVNTNIRI